MSDSHENVLPPAVQKQVDQADAIIAQLNAGTQPQQQPAPDPAPPQQQQAAPDPKPDPKPEATPPADPAPERTDWKHKYSVLQGKYDAEVPRLNADLRDARQTIAGMSEQLNSLAATVAAMKAVKDTPTEPPAPAVSSEEIEQFGPDLIDLIRRVAKSELGTELDAKLRPVKESVKQVGETVASSQESMAKSARERLYERLDAEVPDWEAINHKPEFGQWLREVDGFSGHPRGVSLKAAFERNDADRVVKIFKGFQKEHAVETSDPEPATPAQQQQPEPQQTLDTLVAPGTPKTGSTGAQEGSGKGRIWTSQMISDLYSERNEWIKQHPNDPMPERLDLLERDLSVAQKEGRVRN